MNGEIKMSEKEFPIGLLPRSVWEKQRMIHISEAVMRYSLAGQSVPVKWIEEYNELADRNRGIRLFPETKAVTDDA
jgi:hypothetical protein